VPAMPLASPLSTGAVTPPLARAPEPPSPPTPPVVATPPVDPLSDGADPRLGILQALERGEIDVAEATRRLQDLDDLEDDAVHPSDKETDDGR
jgi:hypothetical protein